MSNAWPFSSFGFDEDKKQEVKSKNKQLPENFKEDNFLAKPEEEHEIFLKDKLSPPIIMKQKPISRLLTNKQYKPGLTEFVSSETEVSSSVRKPKNSENNKCKWTKHKTNPPIQNSRFLVKPKEMKEFFKLTEDTVITDFLKRDSCKRIADKYLIAMVFAYFKRADFCIQDYTRTNFFVALYLANDVEEDEEEIKYEILPWALGKNWRETYVEFLHKRDMLFRQIGYKAIVSRKCCDEIMNIEPFNPLWKRERWQHHGGAIRPYLKDPKENGIPRGPESSPLLCSICDINDSQYDSSSSTSDSSSGWSIRTNESLMDCGGQPG